LVSQGGGVTMTEDPQSGAARLRVRVESKRGNPEGSSIRYRTADHVTSSDGS
jgi:hypothetical protein